MTQSIEQRMDLARRRLAHQDQRSSIRLARELRRIAAGAKLGLCKIEGRVLYQLGVAGAIDEGIVVKKILEAAAENVERYLSKRRAGLVDRWVRSASSAQVH